MSIDFESFKIHVGASLAPSAVASDLKILAALGLAGEAGEIADQIKKNRFHGALPAPQHEAKMALELGDLLWYFALMCRLYNFTLEDIMQANVVKLRERGALRKG